MDFNDKVESMIMETSSEEEDFRFKRKKREKAPNKRRDFHCAYETLVRNYFSRRESVYSEQDFERRFRVPRTIFNRINDALMGRAPFIHYEDATKKKGIYPLVKLVACFRYIA